METETRAIDTLFLEERRYPPAEEFAAQANAQPSIYDEEFESFWRREANERVAWFEPFTKVFEWDRPYAKWFLGGKLNVAWNCLDKHVEAGNGDRVAFFWEGEPEGDRRELTYADLLREVTKLANGLKSIGVGKGTPVPAGATPVAGKANTYYVPGTYQGIKNYADQFRKENGLASNTPLPSDIVTASGSGVDPDISVEAALLQVNRVANARGMSAQSVRDLVNSHIHGRFLGLFGEPYIDVLELNLALDGQK